MRFIIGAVVSSLILSPISVLSMAASNDSTEAAAHIINDSILEDVSNVADFDWSSTSYQGLEKRFCFRRGCKEEKLKRTSGFQCKKKYISSEKIERAKAAGCPEIKKNKQRSAFPSLYTASDFAVPGPYLEWPISRNGRFWNKLSKGKYRIIMTKSCKVVGVVIREKKSSYRTCKDLSKEEDEDE
ncbi:hypothetical protein HI914_05404 [Erysiphe necator]|uniref:Putative secreted effector protein n=1 Tax=Uncinula necator TaxID=52586 RepID=A0A0B1P734_UNCNE|nr:hypothetical protein HI914_05404 [Erysiphe necator]KHJ32479.1 putative secreted effector protein [Erysiphe necator]